MALRDALLDWLPDNGWTPTGDGRKYTGPNLGQGGELTIHDTLIVINQLGWERTLGRDEEPTSLSALVRGELESAGKTPARDLHKLTNQALELWHAQRRAAKIAAAAANVV